MSIERLWFSPKEFQYQLVAPEEYSFALLIQGGSTLAGKPFLIICDVLPWHPESPQGTAGPRASMKRSLVLGRSSIYTMTYEWRKARLLCSGGDGVRQLAPHHRRDTVTL